MLSSAPGANSDYTYLFLLQLHWLIYYWTICGMASFCSHLLHYFNGLASEVQFQTIERVLHSDSVLSGFLQARLQTIVNSWFFDVSLTYSHRRSADAMRARMKVGRYTCRYVLIPRLFFLWRERSRAAAPPSIGFKGREPSCFSANLSTFHGTGCDAILSLPRSGYIPKPRVAAWDGAVVRRGAPWVTPQPHPVRRRR